MILICIFQIKLSKIYIIDNSKIIDNIQSEIDYLNLQVSLEVVDMAQT